MFFNFNYIIVFILLFIFTIISFIFIFASYIFVFQDIDKEKMSPYECGFQPFEDTRNKFNIKYYLLAILFIVFDLELIFMLPWVLTLNFLDLYSYYLMLLFLIILTIGFIYEWTSGALEWD